jgi:hypothetical protein
MQAKAVEATEMDAWHLATWKERHTGPLGWLIIRLPQITYKNNRSIKLTSTDASWPVMSQRNGGVLTVL